MKTALSLAVLALMAAGNACAGDTGTINQAGTYEQTLKFYMHPALIVRPAHRSLIAHAN